MEGKCPVCGAPMENNICGYCGHNATANTPVAPQQNIAAQPQVSSQSTINNGVINGVSRKSKVAALLLCIFLGYWGIHRFYVGKIGTGILYLFTCGLFGIGWIVDIILIATGSFRDSFDLPLQQ